MERRPASRRRDRRLPKSDPRHPAYAPLGPDDFPVRDAPKGLSPQLERQSLGRRPRYERRPAIPGREAISRALPHIVTAALALLAYAFSFIRGTPGFPAGIILVVIVQAVAAATTWLTDLTGWGRIWLLNLVVCAGLLPLLALQKTLAGAPYVALDRGSAGPALLAGGAAMLALVVIAIMAAGAAWDTPEDAGALFLPAALLVPAILGARGDLSEARALEALAEVFALAAIVTLIGGVLSPGPRLLSVPIAVAIQFLILWITGRGPSFQKTSGTIVPMLYMLLLILAVVLTVLVPIFAWWIRRVVSATRMPVAGG